MPYTKEHLDAVKAFVESGVEPALDNPQLSLFKKRYSENWKVEDNHLVYAPLNLVCVPEEEKPRILKEMYDTFSESLGLGVVGFYKKIQNKYLGIKREDVREFLSKQPAYQITKPKPRAINRVVHGLYPQHRWEVDLLDVSQYSGHNKSKKYILTCIDMFSKYVFAAPLASKKPQCIIDAFESIFENQSKVPPLIMQSDNGTEFKNSEMETFCKSKGITQVFTASHSPNSNGAIENFNGFLRKEMHDLFVRTNSLNWLSHLEDMLKNKNTLKHSRTKFTPQEIWTPTREKVVTKKRKKKTTKLSLDDTVSATKETPEFGRAEYCCDKVAPEIALTQQQKQTIVRETTESLAQKNMQRFHETQYEVGDKVRVAMTAIDNRVRNITKRGNQKLLPVKFTAKTYTIFKTFNKKSPMNRVQYMLEEAEHGTRRFYANELRKVDNEESPMQVNVEKLNQAGYKSV